MDNLISTGALAALIGTPDLVVLDASLHLPDSGRDAHAEFLGGHIPGARFLALGHDLPDAALLAARMAASGIDADSRVVVYDDSAIRSAARAWFLLGRLAGHRQVAVLDGGLGKWRAERRPLASGDQTAPLRPLRAPALDATTAWRDPDLLRGKHAMLANVDHRAEEVIDARGHARFAGIAPEPRAGVAGGHIPGSRNVPYTELFAEDGTYRDPAALRDVFARHHVALDRPLVATCGSGITACTLILALDRIGRHDVALYDGSWAEWGADPRTPKATRDA